MKRRKLLLCWTALHSTLSLIAFLTLLLSKTTQSAIVPPPWSDPEKNPCASMPGGWQLLYWPPLKQCFKIFTIGYPCPETMELSPTATVSKTKSARHNAPAAECRCPPGTALSAETNRCHEIFKRGPCEHGSYFSPLPEDRSAVGIGKRPNNRWGTCTLTKQCPMGMIYWAQDGKCYTQYTKGPCIKGKLLVLNDDDLGECKCKSEGPLRDYFHDQEETCHEHYTKGPCFTPGDLFLPGGRCGCHRHLPHYSDEHQMCYELNTPGPCPPGHIFNIPDNFTENQIKSTEAPRAQCQCKEGYVPWKDGLCYRLYTRGPCGANEFLINATSCVRNFCGKSRLYFPDQNTCYRIGSQGPCSLHQVVVFDFTARPSVDGIAFNGICGCSGVIWNLDKQCSNGDNEDAENACDSTPGMVELNGNCFKLYTRGPCGPGQWLEPIKTNTIGPPKAQRLLATKAKCVCRPGYILAKEVEESGKSEINLPGGYITHCNAPTVELARYLNRQRENSKLLVNFNFPNFQL